MYLITAIIAQIRRLKSDNCIMRMWILLITASILTFSSLVFSIHNSCTFFFFLAITLAHMFDKYCWDYYYYYFFVVVGFYLFILIVIKNYWCSIKSEKKNVLISIVLEKCENKVKNSVTLFCSVQYFIK